MVELLYTVIAQAEGGQGGGATSFIVQLLPLVIIFGIMYFLIIRPQSQKQKKQQEYLAQLKKGDKVVTQGGLCGEITQVDAHILTIDLGSKTKVKVLRSHVLASQDQALSSAASGQPLPGEKK